jgi:hypothetical protein
MLGAVLRGWFDDRLRGSMTLLRPARRAWLLAGGVASLLAVLIWVLWPAPEVEPRARQYRDVTGCLLTGQAGVTGARAAPVWAGMQAASARTHGQVRFLAVTGDQTVGNAKSFAGSLVLGRCAVIVAEPGIADGAVRAVAGQHPEQRFVVVGGAVPSTGNVSRVDASSASDITAQVAATVGDRLAAVG